MSSGGGAGAGVRVGVEGLPPAPRVVRVGDGGLPAVRDVDDVHEDLVRIRVRVRVRVGCEG